MLCDEDDRILCEKARQGCEQAFRVLFQRHYDAVHGFVFRLCLDASGADDIVQDAFIKASRSLAGFRGDASFRNWLYRIAMNTTRDWQRSLIRRKQAAEELARESEEAAVGRPADFGPVHEALAALADEMRHAIVLVYYEGLNHAQAARVLGCAETTVSWRIFRARRRLKQLLTRVERVTE
jgi:RNA polymerase sigma-70 factor (ECF subfamily)